MQLMTAMSKLRLLFTHATVIAKFNCSDQLNSAITIIRDAPNRKISDWTGLIEAGYRPNRTLYSTVSDNRLFLEWDRSIMKNKVKVYSKITGNIFCNIKMLEIFKNSCKILAVLNSFHLSYAIICQDVCPARFRQTSDRIQDQTFF